MDKDFEIYCRNCTNQQLRNIIEDTKGTSRDEEAAIARVELIRRNAQ